MSENIEDDRKIEVDRKKGGRQEVGSMSRNREGDRKWGGYQEIGRVSGNREDVSFSNNQIQATSLETLP